MTEIKSINLMMGSKEFRTPELLVPKNEGDKFALFMFYPADFTFVCPTEIMELDGLVTEFDMLGCETYAVSGDSYFCHKAWLNSPTTVGGLGGMVRRVTLLSDPEFKLAEFFQAKKPDKNLMKRKTAIFDKQRGEVIYEATNPDDIGRDLKDVLRILKSYQALDGDPESFCMRKSPIPIKKGDFSFLT